MAASVAVCFAQLVAAAGADDCSVVFDKPDVERFGGDYNKSCLARSATAGDCAALCCADARCAAFSFNTLLCGDLPCCQLKSYANVPSNNTYGPAAVRTGVVLRGTAEGSHGTRRRGSSPTRP